MTKEEYEIKVQSMPQELQKSLRESLEISLSKRIVNRFMSTVMQAYAWGQRAQQKADGNAEYNRGAVEVIFALRDISEMSPEELYKYFHVNCYSHLDGLYEIIHNKTIASMIEASRTYREDKASEKEERDRAAVKAIADSIGLEKLCKIADEMRREEELPY